MKTPGGIFSRCFCSISFNCAAALLAGLCLTAGTVLGGDEPGVKKETKKEARPVVKQEKKAEEMAVITGSLIPQKAKRGRILVTSSPVVVISRQDIERSGASTVIGVLKQPGLSR